MVLGMLGDCQPPTKPTKEKLTILLLKLVLLLSSLSSLSWVCLFSLHCRIVLFETYWNMVDPFSLKWKIALTDVHHLWSDQYKCIGVASKSWVKITCLIIDNFGDDYESVVSVTMTTCRNTFWAAEHKVMMARTARPRLSTNKPTMSSKTSKWLIIYLLRC